GLFRKTKGGVFPSRGPAPGGVVGGQRCRRYECRPSGDWDVHQLDLRRVRPKLGERMQLVLAVVANARDAGVDQHLEAVDARRVGEIDRRVADGRAVLRRLRDGVDLGVDAPKAVLFPLAGGRVWGGVKTDAAEAG